MKMGSKNSLFKIFLAIAIISTIGFVSEIILWIIKIINTHDFIGLSLFTIVLAILSYKIAYDEYNWPY